LRFGVKFQVSKTVGALWVRPIVFNGLLTEMPAAPVSLFPSFNITFVLVPFS
jgi:hypothetical protein